MKKLVVSLLALGLLVLQVAPGAIAAYNFPASYGPVSGDCTTPSSTSAVITCTKVNGTATTAYNPAAVVQTGGTINGVAIGGTTPAAGSFTTITSTGTTTSSGGQVNKVTKVTTGASYTVQVSDYIVDVNKTTGSATAIGLPSSPVDGQTFYIKDKKGDANTNNITITPASGTIDGAASVVMTQPYQSALLIYDGTAATWSVY